MASRDLTFNITAKDGASPVFGALGDSGEKMSTRIGGAISDLGDKIGGELGEVLSTAGASLEKFGESGAQMGTKLAAAGVGVAGLGVALGNFGSADKAAEQQLDAAIAATGASVDDYSKQIGEVVSKGEDFGHSAADVDQALAVLTEATGDTGKALAQMTLVENLAAAKHESLAAAAAQVAKVLGGNSKLLKQYNIDVGSGTLSVAQLNEALTLLSGKLAGQAAAASDTFQGKIDSVKQHVDDFAAHIANEVGPSLTFLGTGLTLVGGTMDILAARAEKAAASELESAAASQGTSVALTKQSITAATLADSLQALRLAEVNAAVANEGLTVALEGGAAAEGEMAAATGAADVSMAASLGPIGLGVAAVVGLGKAIQPLANDIGNWVDGNTAALSTMKPLAQAMGNLGTAITQDGDAYGASTKKALTADIANSGLMKTLAGSHVTLADIVTGLGQSDQAWTKQIQTWKSAGQINSYQAVALAAIKGGLDNQTLSTKAADDALKTLGLDTKTTDGYTVDFTDSVHDANLAYAAAGTSASRYADALQGLVNPTLDLDQAQDDFLDGLANIATSVKQNGRTLDDNTVAGRANLTVLRQAIDSYTGLASKQLAAGQSTTQVNATLTTNETKLRNAAIAAGLNKDQVDALIKREGDIKPLIQQQITLDTTKAFEALSTLEDKENYVVGLFNSGDVTDARRLSGEINSGTRGGGGPANAGKASGGIIGMAGGGIKNIFGTPVDEFGNELLDMGTGRVYPHGQTQQMERGGSASGGNTYITIHMPATLQPDAAQMKAVVGILERHVGQGGKVKIARGIN